MNRIESYGPSGFKIRDEWIASSIILTPTHQAIWNIIDRANPLSISSLAPLFDLSEELDCCFIGLPTSQLLPHECRGKAKEKQLLIEVMDIGAACRSYNVLLGEGRRVAAVLFYRP